MKALPSPHRPPTLLLLALLGLGACESHPPPAPPANHAPTVHILQPQVDTLVRAGKPVELAATVSDAEDGDAVEARVLWVSSVSGQLASGSHASATLLVPGEHTLTATVVDSGGLSSSDAITVRVLDHEAPSVTVHAPAPGSTFNLGESFALQCEARSASGKRLGSGEVRWTSELSGPLASADVARAALTVPGEDTLTCLATDTATGEGASATVSVTVRSNRAPAVLITRPERTEVFVKSGAAPPLDATVSFRATAQDFDAPGGPGNLDDTIAWTLEPGGVALGKGPTLAHLFTTPGEFTVVARVLDGSGHAATDSVRVRLVTNLPPQCDIALPREDGARLSPGSEQELKGRCVDPETGAVLAPTWTTTASPASLGTGFELNIPLDVTGSQVLSACAADPDDATLQGCAERPVRVVPNTAPSACAIEAPVSGAVLNAGVPLSLEGTALDTEDPRGELRFVWSSTRDGMLAGGPSAVTRRLVSPGPHTLTLTVTDPRGLSCSATLPVTVNGAPEVTIGVVRQAGVSCLDMPCRVGSEITAVGSAKDVDPPGVLAELAWLDNLGDALAIKGSTATLTQPSPGKHTVVLRATDQAGAVGRGAASFTVMGASGAKLVETVLTTDKSVAALAQTSEGLRYVDGAAATVFRVGMPPVAAMPQDAPARALTVLPTDSGEVLFVGTEAGVARCVGLVCTRHSGGPLLFSDKKVLAVAARATPDLLLLGTENGLVLTRASNPSAGGAPGQLVGRRALQGFAVRQLVLSPSTSGPFVKAWAATPEGLAEVTLRVEQPFEPALASVSVVMHVPPEVPDVDVLSVAVSPEGQVYVGTRRGFGALGQEGPALRASPWNLPDEQVQALLFERHPVAGAAPVDVLWAGTRNGLVRYDLARDIVTPLGTQDGLLDADVRALATRPEGGRYIATARGISRYEGD
ncbi:hypothetical protein JGU66_14945 [Myxococcaceae bacterium JPH2]|nr:hypothetical protein [Myxococcaceae bacterium JPH2]